MQIFRTRKMFFRTEGWFTVLCLCSVFLSSAWSETVPYTPDLTRQYPNLLYNPSFEIPDWFSRDDHSEFWGRSNWTQRETDPAHVHSGEASYRVFGPVSGSGYSVVNNTEGMTLQGGQNYRLRYQMKIDSALSGTGVHFRIYQFEPYSAPVLQTSAQAAATDGWVEVSTDFTPPAAYENGVLRIYADLLEGDEVWIDDVVLEAVGSSPPVAPAPTITPDAAVTSGPQHVTLSTTLDNATIRYTIDGTDPHVYSTLYQRPFYLPGAAQVRARVFKTSHQSSPVASIQVSVHAQYQDGRVPFYPVGYGQDVEDWWANHPYNPESPDYVPVGTVVSPANVVNVADMRDANPGTETAGIQEAIDSLPASGGTLFFEKARGPYVITKASVYLDGYPDNNIYYDIHGSILLLGQSNVHFVADEAGTVIRADSAPPSDPRAAANLMLAMDSLDYGSQGFPNPQEPARNFYFKNLTFDGSYDDDGDGQGPRDGDTDDDANYAGGPLLVRHCTDILWDNCEFVNFYPAYLDSSHWHGFYGSAVKSDNQWVRNCRFDSRGQSGYYLDGIHNGGAIDCVFTDQIRGGIIFFTNNDVVRWSAEERNCQYMVVQGCEFYGQSYGYTAISLGSVANTLIRDNTVVGPYRNFVEQIGRGESNIQPYVRYSSNAVRIIENTIQDVNQLLYVNRDIVQFSPLIEGPFLLHDNVAEDIKTLVEIDPVTPMPPGETEDLNRDSLVGNLLLTSNSLNRNSGEGVALVRIDPADCDQITSVLIARNYFGGALREVVIDNFDNPFYGDRGEPVRCENIIFEDNEPSPPAPENLTARQNGSNWVLNWTDNADDEWFYTVCAWEEGASGEAACTTTTGATSSAPATASWTLTFDPVLGTTYWFEVAAWYPFQGKSAPAGPVSILSALPAPSASPRAQWSLYR